MSQFSLVITGEGERCNKTATDGESIKYGACHRFDCPDCVARFVTRMLRDAGTVNHLRSTMTHFVGSEFVADDLIKMTRHIRSADDQGPQ